jgi:F0F1-type ATP synthase membrane subunit c/vacuolar-type H+-ATPase subunit K
MDMESVNSIVGVIKYLAAGVAMIAMGGVGIGIGSIFASFISELSRNPGAKKTLFTYTLIGVALTETMALYVLVIVFIILFS